MRFSLAIGALLASSFPVMSQVSPNPVELNHFADSVMECLISREEVAAEAEATRAAISALPDRLSRLVHEAQRLFLLGWAELGFNRQRLGEQLFERAIKVARESIELEPTSEGYRVLADGLNQLLNVRGPAYKLFNHQTTRRSSLTAVELDETNALAHISAAGYLISAPVIAGGDLQRGIDHAQKAIELAGDSHYVRFAASIWLAIGAAGRNLVEAERQLAVARSIYPRNWWLAEVAAALGLE